MSDDILERAISLVHEGKVQEAHELLDSLMNAEVHNVQAWLWYAKTCASPAERQEALQAGLSYNPDDPTLQQILGKAPGAPRPGKLLSESPARSTSLQDPSIVNAIQASRAAGAVKQPVEAPSRPGARIPTWAMLGSGVLLVAFIGVFAWIALKPRPQPLDPAQYRHAGVVEYYLYVPQNYTPDRDWPLFVGIHGFGGSGLDCWNWWQSYADREGFILLCPSLADMDGGWYQDAGEAKLFSALNEVRADYRVGPREFLAGFSAGAEFVQGFAFKYPQYVSGVAILSSGNYVPPAFAARVPMLVVIGDRDDPSAVSTSADFSSTLQEYGFDVQYIVLPGVGHALTERGQQLTMALFRRTQKQ